MPSSGYGRATTMLWWHGLRDRLTGQHARANARWGHLHPPAEGGRVLWVHTGAGEMSVRLGAELLGAIRQHRYDLRLVLTFEQDYPQALEKRLKGLQKIGYGFGPCDAPRAIRRSFQRLDPFALLCVDELPPNLLREANLRGIHVIAFNAPPVQDIAVEICYPRDPRQADAWRANGHCATVATPADPLSQLVEAQVEPTFRHLVSGARPLNLGWVHLADAGELAALERAWRGSAMADDALLFVSLDTGGTPAPPSGKASWSRLSTWDRKPLTPGRLIWVDEPRWYPALAVSSDFIHLASAPREVLWQALAGGVPVSFRTPETVPALDGGADFPCDRESAGVFTRWAACRDDPVAARRQGDRGRRRFWEERRRSATVIEALQHRVYHW